MQRQDVDMLGLAKPLSLQAHCHAIQAAYKQWWSKGGRGFPACFGILSYTLCGFLQETLYINDQTETEQLTSWGTHVVHSLTVTNLFFLSSKASLHCPALRY